VLGVRELEALPDDEVVICCTGTQGEPTSALVRMANDDHRSITLRSGDTVVLSATPIPGNEELVHRTLNNLFRQGVDVLYHSLAPVHVSGHASREELKLMLRLVAPRYFVPCGGEYRMLVLHGQLARQLGMAEEDIFVVENGQVVAFDGRRAWLDGEESAGFVYVDGLGVGDIGSLVLRDRHHLARDGFVVVVVAIDAKTGTLAREPEVLTRGFVFIRESGDLIADLRDRVVELVDAAHGAPDVVNEEIREQLGRYIHERTRRRPMVLPVLLEV
jgi:ribonuclease J